MRPLRARVGFARAEITPPEGIRARNWGASGHSVAQGVHRPLTATIAVWPDGPLALASLDLGWWRSTASERHVRDAVLAQTGLPEASLIIALTHTHAGPTLALEEADLEGGAAIRPYLEQIASTIARLVEVATEQASTRTLVWDDGPCQLARNRDLALGEETLCGYNPAASTNDTLTVGSLVDGHGAIVHYACHPTTLGPANRAISPDFVGAMREVVEPFTGPVLFLQGASGDLAPAEQYAEDPGVADRAGLVLGHAAAAVVLGSLDGCELRLSGKLESGATLAIHERVPCETSDALSARLLPVDLPLKQLPNLAEIDRMIAEAEGFALERLLRLRSLRASLGDGASFQIQLVFWNLGDQVLIGVPGEAYNALQRRFAGRALIVNVANGWLGYFPTPEAYCLNVYPAQQTPFAPECLERIALAIERELTYG